MNLTTDFANFANAPYPADTRDPAKKTPLWVRQMAAGGLTEFARNKTSYRLWAHDPDVAENLSYARGEQDTARYRRRKAGRGTSGLDANSLEVTNRDGSFDAAGEYVPRGGSGGLSSSDPLDLESIIESRPLPLLPVKLRGLKATITQPGYQASITALGRKADKETDDHAKEVRFWMDQAPDMAALGHTPGPGIPDPLPVTEPELRTYLDDYQIAAAAELERKLLICNEECGLNQLLSECVDDLLTHGYAALADEQLPGQRPRSLRIPVHRGLFLPSAYPDGRDQTQGGYLHTLTLAALRAEIEDNGDTCNADGKPWGKDDYAVLERQAAQSLPEALRGGVLAGDAPATGSLTVARWYFLSDEPRTWKVRQDAAGNTRTKPIRKFGYELQGNGRLMGRTVSCLYEATLVQGTALAYNCRKVYDQGRDLHDPLKARLPFCLAIPDGTPAGGATSIVRNAKGLLDEIERSWRAFMAVRRTYTPEGVNVPPDLLEKMADALKIGGDNPIFAAYEFIKSTGDSFFPRTDPENPGQQNMNPITANPFGVPAAAMQHLESMFQQIQLLEAITGANAVVSAATPGTDAGKGVNQLALQGAANVMAHLRDGMQRLFERHTRNLAGRIWLTEKNVPVTGALVGRGGRTLSVGPRPDLHEYGFFLKVSPAPTEAEWQQLYAKAAEASANGQITVADEMMLFELDNLKVARRYVAVAVTRKARQDEQKALGLQKANGDVQTQTAQAAEAAKQQTAQLQHNLEMERLTFTRETAFGSIDRQVAAQQAMSREKNATAEAVAQLAVAGKLEADQGRDLRQHTHEVSQWAFDALTRADEQETARQAQNPAEEMAEPAAA